MTKPEARYFYADFGRDSDEWDLARPLAVPDQPLSIPREWAGHICIAIAHLLNRSEEEFDLQVMKGVTRRSGKNCMLSHRPATE